MKNISLIKKNFFRKGLQILSYYRNLEESLLSTGRIDYVPKNFSKF